MSDSTLGLVRVTGTNWIIINKNNENSETRNGRFLFFHKYPPHNLLKDSEIIVLVSFYHTHVYEYCKKVDGYLGAYGRQEKNGSIKYSMTR